MLHAVTLHVAIKIRFLLDLQQGGMMTCDLCVHVETDQMVSSERFTAVHLAQQMLHCLKSEMYLHRATVQQTC